MQQDEYHTEEHAKYAICLQLVANVKYECLALLKMNLVATILTRQLPGKDTKFTLEFVLTSNTVTVPPSEPVVPVPTFGEVILEKIFNDEAHEDVLFSFDSQSATSEMVEETSAALDIASNDSVDTRISVKFPQDSAMDPSKVDEDKDQLEPRVKRMRGSDPYTIGAHKLMLCQWPYFKAMFEGGFSEGGTGKKNNSDQGRFAQGLPSAPPIHIHWKTPRRRQANNDIHGSAQQVSGCKLGVRISTCSSLRHPRAD